MFTSWSRNLINNESFRVTEIPVYVDDNNI